MALEAPLLDELLCFGAKIAIVAVGKFSLLFLIDRIPLWADFHSASETNLLSALFQGCHVLSTIAVDDGCGRGPAIEVALRHGSKCFGGQGYLIRLPSTATERQVGLLEVLRVKLQDVQSRIVHQLVHSVDRGGLGRHMLLAPDPS
jgi:hypothetical protein